MIEIPRCIPVEQMTSEQLERIASAVEALKDPTITVDDRFFACLELAKNSHPAVRHHFADALCQMRTGAFGHELLPLEKFEVLVGILVADPDQQVRFSAFAHDVPKCSPVRRKGFLTLMENDPSPDVRKLWQRQSASMKPAA